MAELRGAFRPEFLNRVDDIVLFKRLTLEQIERIVDLRFDEVRSRIAERGLDIELTEAARQFIAARGFDPVYGARPLRRYIAHDVETRIGRALLSGEITDNGVIHVDAADGELQVRFEQRESHAVPRR